MALSAEQLRDNPWWTQPSAIQVDPHLAALAAESLVFEHEIPFDLSADSVLTIRGPRQVGKTTLLKRMVRGLLQNGVAPRAIMYLDVEGANLRTPYDLQESIREFLEWMRTTMPDERAYILLDEITGITSWGTAIRVLHGRGNLGNSTVVCTGSHARDVKRGAERAPGRKGAVEAWDWIMTPLCFRDYVALHDPSVAAGLPAMDPSRPAAAFEAAQEISLHRLALDPLFDRYLLTGGYPPAFSAEAELGEIPPRIYRLYQEAFRGEIVRAGHREDLFRELVAWMNDGRIGNEFNWSDGSGETAIGSHHTVREYLESAQAAFLWHIVHRVRSLAGPVPAARSPKKAYPVDPFTWHVLRAWVSGAANPWREAMEFRADPRAMGIMIESVVADHLRRWRGPYTLYHRAPQGSEEIDFVVFDGESRILVEVKYREAVKPAHRRVLGKHGGGLLVTKDTLFLDKDDNVAGIPVSTFLAGLAHPLTLFPGLE